MPHKSTKSLKPAPEMDDQEEIFPNLPPEIVLNILSRIPIKAVFTCKCVCKSWLELLESPEFALSHLSNSVPGFLIQYRDYTKDTKTEIFAFEDSLEIERPELHYKRVLKLKGENTFGDSTPWDNLLQCSTNGLLFIRKSSYYYVCNPITHECLKLPKPSRIPRFSVVTHGFGVSRLSNQYKVVKIFHDEIEDDHVKGLLSSIPEIFCQVYTLGTGSWRSITGAPRETLVNSSTGKLLNGNLHWLTVDSMGALWISRFDIETEVFTKFRAPMLECCEESLIEIGVLRDRLCVSETSSTNEIVIYLMTDDGHEKESWNKEYVISSSKVNESHPGGPDSPIDVCPLKAFRNGDLLLVMDGMFLLCYSRRTKTVALVDVFNEDENQSSDPILYAPSFISLKDFETENAKLIEFVCSMRLAS